MGTARTRRRSGRGRLADRRRRRGARGDDRDRRPDQRQGPRSRVGAGGRVRCRDRDRRARGAADPGELEGQAGRQSNRGARPARQHRGERLNVMSNPRRSVRLAALLLGVVFLPGCGYALEGRNNNLPPTIRIIGIPLFTNQSTVSDLDVMLSDAVRSEFQSHGHYKAIPEEEGADAVLTATIKPIGLRPVGFNSATRQVSRYAVTVSAAVVFKDSAGKTLWSNGNVQATEEYDVTTSTATNDPS